MGGTLAAAGEPDEASRVGMGALKLAQETNSTRTLQELMRLVARVSPWSDQPAVRELCEAVLMSSAG
jgi:hypothetical protein